MSRQTLVGTQLTERAFDLLRACFCSARGSSSLRLSAVVGARRVSNLLTQCSPLREARQHLGRDLQRESRLADTTHAGGRHEGCSVERSGDGGELGIRGPRTT